MTARDWLFGSRPRRLVLRFILDGESRAEGWTKAEIAVACDLSPNGGAAAHVAGLVALGLLEEVDRRYKPARLDNALFAHVAALVADLENVPEVAIAQLLADRKA